MNWDLLCQILIPIFSGASIYFLAGKKNIHYGFIVGLIGQPMWIYSTWKGGLWGMLIISAWFTGNYVRGLLNHRRG